MNKYCLEHKLENGIVLIHNCFTGAEVMIKPFEYINIFTNSPCDYADFLSHCRLAQISLMEVYYESRSYLSADLSAVANLHLRR